MASSLSLVLTVAREGMPLFRKRGSNGKHAHKLSEHLCAAQLYSLIPGQQANLCRAPRSQSSFRARDRSSGATVRMVTT